MNVGIDLLKRIKILHSQGILYRDLKPSNIAFGIFSTENSKEKNELYIIDYGLSTRYLDKENKHFKFLNGRKFVDTLKYTSRLVLNCERPSSRDDVESIFYILIYLFQGNLPWEFIQIKYTKIKKYVNTREFLQHFNEAELLKGLPDIFKFIYKNIKILEFEDEPSYDIFISLLEKEKEKIIIGNNFIFEYKFIWIKKLLEELKSKKKEIMIH